MGQGILEKLQEYDEEKFEQFNKEILNEKHLNKISDEM